MLGVMRCQVTVRGEEKEDLLRRIAFKEHRSVHEQCNLIVDEWLEREIAKQQPTTEQVEVA